MRRDIKDLISSTNAEKHEKSKSKKQQLEKHRQFQVQTQRERSHSLEAEKLNSLEKFEQRRKS